MPQFSITLVNNFAEPFLGGGERQLLTLVDGLLCAGADVTVVCAQGSALQEEVEASDARAIPVDFCMSSFNETLDTIKTTAETSLILQGTGYYTNVLTRLMPQKAPYKVVNVHHVMFDAQRKAGSTRFVRDLVNRFTQRRADIHIAVSHAVADSMTEFGIPAERIVVILNGVEPPDISVLEEKPLDPQSPTIGFLGRLEAVKGPDVFLDMMSELRTQVPGARYFIAGEGSEESSLKSRAKALGLADAGEFVGFIPTAMALSRIDILVLAARSEGLPLAPIEAQYARVPVVATKVGGTPEVVIDKKTGLLCPPEDPQALAKGVRTFLDDPKLREAITSEAARFAAETFSPETMVTKYLDVYSQLLA